MNIEAGFDSAQKGTLDKTEPSQNSDFLVEVSKWVVRRWVRYPAAAAFTVSTAFLTPPAIIQAYEAPRSGIDCEFVSGFGSLYNQIPQVVGECTEDEHFEPETGNALQATTHGLLVWRKIDNWTAFTDGTTTWINGPEGLQSRPNDERFAWEQEEQSDGIQNNIICTPENIGPVDPAEYYGRWVGCIEGNYPWHNQLPLSSDNYFVMFNQETEKIEAVIYLKGPTDDASVYQQEILAQLTAIGADTTLVEWIIEVK